MDPEQFAVAIGSSVLTAAVTLTAVYFTHRSNTARLRLQLEHDEEKLKQEVRREKIEELYVLSRRWCTLMSNANMPIIEVMKGKLDYNQALDIQINTREASPVQFERLGMLVDLYLPELTGPLEALYSRRDHVNDIVGKHKARYKKGDVDGHSFVKPAIEALLLFSEEGDAFSKAIVQVARESGNSLHGLT